MDHVARRPHTEPMHGEGSRVDGTYYEVEGEGPTVIIAGGGPGTGHSHYHPWFSRLADRMKLVYFDYFGTGRSDPGECSIEAYAGQIETLRRELGGDTVSVIGISFGGMPALHYALVHGVERLVLSNAQISARTWKDGNIDSVNAALRAQFPERWNQMLALRDAGVRSLDPRYQALFDEVVTDLEWVDPYGHPPLRHDEYNGARIDVYAAVVGDDPEWCVTGTMAGFDPPLGDITAPTLLATGRWDRLTSPAIAQRAANAIPGATMLVFERSAHRPWVEEPDAYFRAVGDFFT